ncbi:signal peptidase II [Sphingomonas desiccabilis]|uniref:Lipoprotein signal peptidase n=1 Tax=Sphingomonas desiccabilis TaxID=429134 RepID=A0A4Q2IPQ6_9SPHN|nr:signal peptidase II [Sphingomonas desiccabilis]MBB3911721.1 signal peptidase II [Sphingomonas desiccabilis]RXZ31552.1 signal peptidase II [Sphingomonas desiccabilis]
MQRTRLHGFLLAGLIFIVDQAVKFVVTGPLGVSRPGDERILLPIFDLRFVPNVGVSLGLLPADSSVMRWLLVLLTAAIASGVAWWMLREKSRPDLFALAMVLGGALGNILDRVRFGYVVDFLDLHFGTWRPFLIFNVADAAITIGVLILLVRAVLVRDKPAETPAGEKVNA